MRDHAETERRLVAMLPAAEQAMVAGALGRMMLAGR
jgi:hypothetical protein